MTLTEAKKNFLQHCALVVNLSQNTLRAYESDLDDAHRFFGRRTKLEDVRPEHLRGYIEHLRVQRQLKETTIKRRLASLKLLFIWAEREKLIEGDPFHMLNERIRLPKRLPRALDRSDRECLRKTLVLRASIDDFDVIRSKTAIHLLLDTGIRVGELVAIDLRDLSLANESLLIHGKGNRQRLVYVMQKPLYRKMEKYLAYRRRIQTSSDRLFVLANGRPIGPVKVRAELRSLCRTAGIVRHVTPHMLRHTCATQWLESGVDIRYVQKLLGHQSISTTEIYTHVSDLGLREALFKATGGFRR
ncbi:tyrosine-type recombinase/integrase [Burkholderia sp. WAC0059]|uniref:tyrosine-type recombinase/integrase n=1 Tax=Burkholderia sp. WAC0059 TaxID=2066022 RepID=UPI0015E0CA43|nr:tyrosine-type recombinase/integrase [Burkholderia sp. WAC0059]